jgi:GDPmannose 4,6-dehydratase
MNKKAIITGITGQDGSYLAELLLSKGYEVHGMMRRASTYNTRRIDHIFKDPHDATSKLFLHYWDITDGTAIPSILSSVRPDEFYNLAAQSHVRVSFDMPVYTGDVVGLGVTRILESIRSICPGCRYYQASSSEMFGNSPSPQSETTPFDPVSPYAAAKVYAYHMTKMYREGYGLHASNGILFNHESPRRGPTFLTRKVTMAIADIIAGKKDRLYLGNLSAFRDFGYAPQYVEMMWKMLQQDKSDDYVIGTGISYSIEHFIRDAFAYAGMDYNKYVFYDERYTRPVEVNRLNANPSKAMSRLALGYDYLLTMQHIIRIMVDADMERVCGESNGEGRKIIEKRMTGAWHKWEDQVVSMEDV